MTSGKPKYLSTGSDYQDQNFWAYKYRLLPDAYIAEILGDDPAFEWNIEDPDLSIRQNISVGMAVVLMSLCWSAGLDGFSVWEPNGDTEPKLISWENIFASVFDDAGEDERAALAQKLRALIDSKI